MNLKHVTKTIWSGMKKRSPEILTGVGIAGMVGTTIMAVRATPKAILLINEKEVELHVEKLSVKETVKATWKCYIPAAITGITSIACLVGASSVSARRNAAIATAYTISESALREYREKVVETIGEKKERTVRDAIAKDKLDQNPVGNSEVIVTEKGNTLCYDIFSGRYFKSDVERLKRAENTINRQMLDEGSVCLNDFYYEIGLDETKVGHSLGWDNRKGLISLLFSSQLASDNTPCVVIDFNVAPSYDFYQ